MSSRFIMMDVIDGDWVHESVINTDHIVRVSIKEKGVSKIVMTCGTVEVPYNVSTVLAMLVDAE